MKYFFVIAGLCLFFPSCQSISESSLEFERATLELATQCDGCAQRFRERMKEFGQEWPIGARKYKTLKFRWENDTGEIVIVPLMVDSLVAYYATGVQIARSEEYFSKAKDAMPKLQRDLSDIFNASAANNKYSGVIKEIMVGQCIESETFGMGARLLLCFFGGCYPDTEAELQLFLAFKDAKVSCSVLGRVHRDVKLAFEEFEKTSEVESDTATPVFRTFSEIADHLNLFFEISTSDVKSPFLAAEKFATAKHEYLTCIDSLVFAKRLELKATFHLERSEGRILDSICFATVRDGFITPINAQRTRIQYVLQIANFYGIFFGGNIFKQKIEDITRTPGELKRIEEKVYKFFHNYSPSN